MQQHIYSQSRKLREPHFQPIIIKGENNSGQ